MRHREPISEIDLERHLAKLSVDMLSATELCCDDCRRTPLIGEVVYRYPKSRTVCALCRVRHSGEPLSSIPVRHGQEIRAQRLDPKYRRAA